jgi:hypothetical protein
MKIRKRIRNTLISAISVALMLVLLLPSLALATPSVLPPRPTPSPGAPAPRKSPTGAYIVLHMTSAPAEVWTVVQWQDAFGDWQDVEGWQGTLDDAQHKTWWVAKKDFDTGPFRWAVYREKAGPLVLTSDSFFLPDGVGKTSKIEIPVEP